ncbi:MAG TPA: hypothetical protein VL137_09190 [Polyangiaceae bacterium]|nr:hypothetical protein [Polyangiaceae bacterium]
MKRLNSWGNSRRFRCHWMLLAGLALTSLDLVACNLNPQPEPPLGVPSSTGGPTAATGGATHSSSGGSAGGSNDIDTAGMSSGGGVSMNGSGGGFSAGGASATAGTSGTANPPPVYPAADASAPLPNDTDAGADGGDAQ